MIKRLIKLLGSCVARPRSGPNLNKIAAEIGVSVATVSNALSGKGRVSAEMVERIRARAAELGYVPSPAARALRTGRTRVLGLVLPDIANPLFPQIAQAIEFAASRAGYGVLIADSHDDISSQTEAVDRLIEREVDGMLIVPRRGTRISDIGCPVAVIDTPSTPGNTVSADHWGGGHAVGAHLSELGHKKVLILGGSPSSNVQNDRVAGIKSGLGPSVVTQLVWIERLDRERGPGCSLELAAKVAGGFTAFAAVSDLHALRALTELQQAGIDVPARASVTGFDDLIWSAVVSPALTTVHMDMPTIAEIAVSALAAIIETSNPGNPGKRDATVKATPSKVPMQLVARRSSGPAPSANPNPNPAPNQGDPTP